MSTTAFLPEHYINRELSWLEFNSRVLEEALDPANPLLERLKFLAIFASNLDEFFMVRVAGLREQSFGAIAPQDPPSDGLSPLAVLQKISARVRSLVEQQYKCWGEAILPALAEQNIRVLREAELSADQRRGVDKYFRQRIFPVLTPMAIDPSHPSPRFHNKALYLAARLQRKLGIGPERLYAVVQLPQVLPRFVPVEQGNHNEFLLLEDIVAARLTELFGGYEIITTGTFRITRDMDYDLLDEEGDDMLRVIESQIRARVRSEAVRLEVSSNLESDILDMLVTEEDVRRPRLGDTDSYDEVYEAPGPIDMTSFFELIGNIGRKDLQDPPFTPRTPPALTPGDNLFAAINEGDILLHHPFDSFTPVVQFVQQAARDPHVLAIKQTLYRTSGDSPIVSALIEAAEAGKHVTALVELKARFDEANNISWARRMERAGVHVVFGFMDLKTHCKLALVVRQEDRKVKRYAHLGTGNYNPSTAKIYTDMGLFTADRVMTEDVSALFNFLTGYSQNHDWQKLIVAPQDMHEATIRLIDEQAERARRGKRSRVFAKMNALVDPGAIEALYRAGQAGVPIDLVIRGICALRPGIAGLSENIRVRSVVDRFLEHSRICVFGEGPRQTLYLSSADWMPRNFDRRVEVMFPVEAPELRRRILQEIIPTYLRDNVKARELGADGVYKRLTPPAGGPVHRSQLELIAVAEGRSPLPTAPAIAKETLPPAKAPAKRIPREKPVVDKNGVTKPSAKRRIT
jgi:polyphosphate kinase